MVYVVPESEVEFSAIRAQGPGGQNVNKVSNAVHMRFNIVASALPVAIKERLLASADTRITWDGVFVIKAQGARSLEINKTEALARLQEAIELASHVPKRRKATKPTLAPNNVDLKAKPTVRRSNRGAARSRSSRCEQQHSQRHCHPGAA